MLKDKIKHQPDCPNSPALKYLPLLVKSLNHSFLLMLQCLCQKDIYLKGHTLSMTTLFGHISHPPYCIEREHNDQ